MRNGFLILLLLLSYSNFAQHYSTDIKGIEYRIEGEWRISYKGENDFLEQILFPNSIVHQLAQRNYIPSPYFGNNEKHIQYLETIDWDIELSFEAKESEKYLNHEIVFPYLDPYTKVFLNNKLILESDNSFRLYRVDITGQLNFGGSKNILRFEQLSSVKEGKRLQEKTGINYPGEERSFTRRPQFEYGWDWGPRFVSGGIKKNPVIISHEQNYFEILHKHFTIENLNEDKAIIRADVEIYSSQLAKKKIEITDGFNSYAKKGIALGRGVNRVTLKFEIKDPQLWWPNGMGDQSIYPFLISLGNGRKDGECANADFLYAICKTELIRKKDSIGESLSFYVNGKPVYLKGFNMIPVQLIDEVDESNSKYFNLINAISDMNCNAVRIWGGGEYLEKDAMDHLLMNGILVWQDFMFAGTVYPGDTSFTNNVSREINFQTRRLCNYNNIVLWCGNNEIDEAWHNWGWQKQYAFSPADSSSLWKNYKNLFEGIIPKIVNENDPDKPYLPSSPVFGWGRKQSMTHGDSHYWGVWWGKEPIEKFNEKVPRFMSEFGMQAMPDLATLHDVIPDSLMRFDSPEFKNHQKHPTGYETLNHYLEKYLIVPKTMPEYSYATQVLQSMTIRTAIEAQRRNNSRCRGTLIWQLNDVWPVTSWSVIDYDERPKLACGEIKSFFQNQMISVVETNESYDFYVINDAYHYYLDSMEIHVKDFSNQSIIKKSLRVDLSPNSSTKVHRLMKKDLEKFDLTKHYLFAALNKEPVKYFDHFVSLNQLNLEKSGFVFKIEETMTKTQKAIINYYTIIIKPTTYTPYLKFVPDPNHPKSFTNRLQEEIPIYLEAGEAFRIILPKKDFKSQDDLVSYLTNNLMCLNKLLNLD